MFGLFLLLGCYKQESYEHLCASFSMDRCFHFLLGIYLSMELLGHMVILLNLLRNGQTDA